MKFRGVGLVVGVGGEVEEEGVVVVVGWGLKGVVVMLRAEEGAVREVKAEVEEGVVEAGLA